MTVWRLGRHRLACGDSTDPAAVAAFMKGRLADMVWADPPYGMRKHTRGVINDDLRGDGMAAFSRAWLESALAVSKPAASLFVWGQGASLLNFYGDAVRARVEAGELTIRNLLTWWKPNAGAGKRSRRKRNYPTDSEHMLYLQRGSQLSGPNADRFNPAFDGVRAYLAGEAVKAGIRTRGDLRAITGGTGDMLARWFSQSQWCLPSRARYAELQAHGAAFGAFLRPWEDLKAEVEAARAWFDGRQATSDVWRVSRTSVPERERAGGHPTPKPVAVCAIAVRTTCPPGGLVFEPFSGGGSMFEACEADGRTCYGMELSRHFCEVIVRRWEGLTERKAEVEDAGRPFAHVQAERAALPEASNG